VNRLVKPAVFAVATIYFLADLVLANVARPLANWIGSCRLFGSARAWIVSLKPYPTLALFAVPIVILEPIKPLAAYLIATGQILTGAFTLIVGELLKLTFVERLFAISRPKLLQIPFFERGYRYWRTLVKFIRASSAWRSVSERFANIKRFISHMARQNLSRSH
jgi:hypothetical protein